MTSWRNAVAGNDDGCQSEHGTPEGSVTPFFRCRGRLEPHFGPMGLACCYGGPHHNAVRSMDADDHGLLYHHSGIEGNESQDGDSNRVLVIQSANHSPGILGWTPGTAAAHSNTGRLIKRTAVCVSAMPCEPVVSGSVVDGYSISQRGEFYASLTDCCDRFVVDTINLPMLCGLGNQLDDELLGTS